MPKSRCTKVDGLHSFYAWSEAKGMGVTMKRYLLLFAVFLTLAGCSQSASPSAHSTHAEDEFSPGIFIDFTQARNDFITDEILNTLKTNLQAIIEKNKEIFVQGFIPGMEKSNLFWIEGDRQYRFYEIAAAQKEGDRINIAIYYQMEEGGTIEDSGMTYTFLKDKDGVWKIALID